MSKIKVSRKKLKHDELLDLFSSSALHFQTHRKTYISLIALLVVAGIALWAVVYHNLSKNKRAAEILDRSPGVASLVEVSEKYPKTPSAPLALLALAGTYYRSEKFYEAGSAYQLFLQRYPVHELAPFVAMGAAYSRESEGVLDDAIARYRQVEQRYPDSSLVAEAAFNIGRCWLELNRTEDAVAAYRELIERYPESLYGRLAGEELVKLASEAGSAI